MHHPPRNHLPRCPWLFAVAAVLLVWQSFTAAAQASELRRTAIVRAVQDARDSVVNIHGQKTISGGFDEPGAGDTPRRVNGMGTGVIVDSRGYIVTNHHVVQGVRRIQVTLANGKTHFARLVSFDSETDLAIIKIDARKELPTIKVGSSHDLMTGETVIAVGNAYGYEHTVTRGIISALSRTVQVSDTQQYENLIQTDASINPGNSGGPLLNIDGEMIGVNVAVRAGAQGIGFAIPVNKVLNVVAGLLSIRKVDENWHGIVAMTGEAEQQGVVVARLEEESPASKGGLHRGDVIIEAGGQTVKRALDLERSLLGRKSGEEVELVVRRGQKPVKLSIVLDQYPTRYRSKTEQSWDLLGLRVESISPTRFRQLNSKYRGGLRVTEVRSGGPASRQGIRAGDILVGMHIWETISLENLAYVLGRPDLTTLDPLKFYILRGHETLFGHLTLADRRGKK